MSKLRVLELFAGVGGFSCGLDKTGGFETVAVCEIDPFCRAVLKKHWPEAYQYDDVRTLTADRLSADGIWADVITGGFPCQDISVAGKQAGIGEGTRSGLWGECLRLVGEIRPQYAIFENVSNLLSGPAERPGGWFATILRDLADIGYNVEWHDIPASYIGAWHRRGRVWILAYPDQDSGQQGFPKGPILRQRHVQEQSTRSFAQWPGRPNLPAPVLCGDGDGIPHFRNRIAALGNAVVPAIPELIGRAILESAA